MRQNDILPGLIDEQPLAPDLEWMLASGQAGDVSLAQALAHEYFPLLYSLALSVLRDPQAAAHASLESIVSALLNVYHYKGRDGPRGWLFSLAMDAIRRERPPFRTDSAAALYISPTPALADSGDAALWQAFDALDPDTRLALLLSGVHELPPGEVAGLLDTQEDIHLARIDVACQALRPAFSPAQLSPQELFAVLQASLLRRWPVPEFTPSDLDALAAEAAAQASHRRSRIHRSSSLWEVALVAAIIIAVFWMVRRAGLDAPAPAPTPLAPNLIQQTVIVTRSAAILGATSTPPVAPYSRVSAGDRLKYVVQPGDTLESIALSLGITVEDLVQANRLQPGERLVDGRNLSFRVPSGYSPANTPTSVPPSPWLEPLDRESTTAEIRQRMQDSRSLWDTAWLDAWLIEYGPPGYIGPARGYRAQVWYSQPRQSLFVYGSFDSSPDLAMVSLPYETFAFQLPSGNMSSYGAGSSARLNPPLDEMLFPETSPWIAGGGSFRVNGYDRLAGRSVLAVNWLDAQGLISSRLWIDRLTGIVLRQQVLGGPGQSIILSDVQVIRFELNANFPAEVFATEHILTAGFAGDSSGAPEGQSYPAVRLGRVPLPYSLASHSLEEPLRRLTFQYPSEYDPESSRAVIDLFAGINYLGKVEFGNPFTMICDRSPDGRRIAFVSQPSDDPAMDAFLHFFDLAEPLRPLHAPINDNTVTALAFSPDSRHLAAFGRYASLSAIYIIDTDTGESQRLMTFDSARSLVWSPDGRYLALIASFRSQPDKGSLIVLDAATGELVYDSLLAGPGSPLPSDWPGAAWGVPFPVEQGGLAACSDIP